MFLFVFFLNQEEIMPLIMCNGPFTSQQVVTISLERGRGGGERASRSEGMARWLKPQHLLVWI